MQRINVLGTEGFPSCMQEGMRDIEYEALGWSFHVHEESPKDLVHGDSGAEQRNGNDDECPSSKDDDSPPYPVVEDGGVSTTVALPRRFGRPGRLDEDLKSVQVADVASELDSSPESTVKTSLGAILRKRVRKVTVHQDVVDYVKHFQEASEPNIGESLARDDFTRGLEQFCLLHGHAEPGSQNDASVNPAVPSPEICQSSGAGMDQNRQTSPDLQIRPPDEWSRNGHAGDPYTMGYMDNMGGYFPNFCYPYPPPFLSYGQFNFGVHPMYMPMVQVPCFTPPLEYVHKTDDVTKTARRSRVTKRRGHGTDPHHACPTTKTAHVGGDTAQSGNQENRTHQKVAVNTSGQGLSTRDLMLILQKQLSPSGVSSLGRIVLPKKEAEIYLPHLIASEGVLLTMTDFDTAQSWTFRFRFWSNNKSRMYVLENTRDFVKAHNLQERDMLSLYRDAEGIYVVRGEKNGSNQAVYAANDSTAEEDVLAKEDLPQKKQMLNISLRE